MNLYLVRHAQTAYNRDGLGLGRMDVPLTELGERQTAALGRRLGQENITRIFSSPLRRARDMAEAVAGERGVPIEERQELIELDIGVTEGLAYAVMRERHADFMRAWSRQDNVELRMPGGESLADMAKRLEPFVTELLALDEPGVAVVSHNFVTKVMVCQLLGLEIASFRTFAIDVASVCRMQVRNGRISVKALNDCCHLDSLNVDSKPRSL